MRNSTTIIPQRMAIVPNLPRLMIVNNPIIPPLVVIQTPVVRALRHKRILVAVVVGRTILAKVKLRVGVGVREAAVGVLLGLFAAGDALFLELHAPGGGVVYVIVGVGCGAALFGDIVREVYDAGWAVGRVVGEGLEVSGEEGGRKGVGEGAGGEDGGDDDGLHGGLFVM